MESRARPRALRKGDRIALIAPAGPAQDQDRVRASAAVLAGMGFEPVTFPSCGLAHGYLAGPDEARAADIGAAFSDPSIAGIVCLKGGYGTPRILDLVDWNAVRANPKVFAGYSDITGLHLAIAARAGYPTFHAPMPSSDMVPEFDPWSRERWIAALTGTEALGRLGHCADSPPPRPLRGGVAEGRLAGGNLSLVAALMGTPWELDARGAILFLEDIDEAPYRIDRMLTTLRLAGKFRDCAGIVLGSWTRCQAAPGKPSLDLETVFREVLPSGIPILYGLHAGHGSPADTLPLNVDCRLDADRGTLEALEPACRS